MKFQSFAHGDASVVRETRVLLSAVRSAARLSAGAGTLICGNWRSSSVSSNGLPCSTASAGTARAAKDIVAMRRFISTPVS
jgi:hypothetical protein